MARAPKVKKELNQEVEFYVRALKMAVALEPSALVVWQHGCMTVNANIATIHVPCNFLLTRGISAKDLIKAFEGCDQVFTISEIGTEVVVSWGRKRATLQTVDRASVYVRDIDRAQGINDISEHFTPTIKDAIKDLNIHGGNRDYADFVQFYDDALYWTNGNAIAQIKLPTVMPHVLLRMKDLKQIIGDGKDNIKHIWWSGNHTISFYMESGVVVQMPQADASTVKYPTQERLESFFVRNIDDAVYEVTEEHFDAISYVGGFTDKAIYIRSGYIGTHDTPTRGTSQEVDGLPIDICVSADVAKLGGFTKAEHLIKRAAAGNIGFYTVRPNVTFCFSKYKVGYDGDED